MIDTIPISITMKEGIFLHMVMFHHSEKKIGDKECRQMLTITLEKGRHRQGSGKEWHAEEKKSRGKVIEIHPSKRGKNLKKYPS